MRTQNDAVAIKETAGDIRDRLNRRLQAQDNGRSVAAVEHAYATDPARGASPVWAMIVAWGDYAERYRIQCGAMIGHDGVLSDGWEDVARGIRTLLNGPTGGLDGGTCDSIILDTLAAYGVDTKNW